MMMIIMMRNKKNSDNDGYEEHQTFMVMHKGFTNRGIKS